VRGEREREGAGSRINRIVGVEVRQEIHEAMAGRRLAWLRCISERLYITFFFFCVVLTVTQNYFIHTQLLGYTMGWSECKNRRKKRGKRLIYHFWEKSAPLIGLLSKSRIPLLHVAEHRIWIMIERGWDGGYMKEVQNHPETAAIKKYN
jgi:hypothetical protein